ncbi:hypothetical protein [Burkholderia cenocepacia]|uniref:hypothetical protein n=1 Tax=Burkholderia cenocepacia TaxID=95486 RepID=UPI000761494C|nr:hypothetical protein [Burkholderia cenocepacia]KWU24797.1 hypothetical protein AS149_32135 [Burkholderia cenocepacia]
MDHPLYAAPLSVREASLELARLGQLLDAADCRQLAVSARLYQQAALRAKVLLEEHMGVPAVRRVCEEYTALQEVLANLLFDSASPSNNFDFSQLKAPRP